VPFGDSAAAAQALVELAGDPALRRRLGEAAHARFHARFTVAAVKAVFSGLYGSLISAPDRKEETGARANRPASLTD
jgi:glycosyltransferase involved in cell wall biosynthesis